MRISDILARFLSLLDVTILLLGLFLVLLAAAKDKDKSSNGKSSIESAARAFIENSVTPIWIYAFSDGGPYREKCCLLNENFEPERIIDISTENDVSKLITGTKKPVIFIITKKGSIDGRIHRVISQKIDEGWGRYKENVTWLRGVDIDLKMQEIGRDGI